MGRAAAPDAARPCHLAAAQAGKMRDPVFLYWPVSVFRADRHEET